jgi:hypothetical protein
MEDELNAVYVAAGESEVAAASSCREEDPQRVGLGVAVEEYHSEYRPKIIHTVETARESRRIGDDAKNKKQPEVSYLERVGIGKMT